MKIKSRSQAIPGQSFVFAILDTSEQWVINATIDGDVIWVGDCPDPPCHQMSFDLPANSFGKRLVIEAKSSSGESESLELTIAPPTGAFPPTGTTAPTEKTPPAATA
jgi:hypothetical protein